MSHTDHDDAQLLARARQGDASSFAILLHRHGPAVHAAASDPSGSADDADTHGAPAATTTLTRTYLEAMRRLEDADDQDVRRWLLQLALEEEPSDERLARAREPEPLPSSVLDQVWAELVARWPTGRRPLRAPRWVGHIALLVVLVVLAAGVPYVVLVTASESDDAPPPISEVVAEPLEDEDAATLGYDADTSTTELNAASPNIGALPDDLDPP